MKRVSERLIETFGQNGKRHIQNFNSLGPSASYSDGYSMEEVNADRRSRKRRRDLIAQLEYRLNANFRQFMRERKLVAYGRPGSLRADAELIAWDIWPALTVTNWSEFAVGENRRDGAAFFAVRVFPALLAPCRDQLLDKRPLADAFKAFILHDPEVAALAALGLKKSSRFERVFREGSCTPLGVAEWPVAFDRWIVLPTVHPDPEKRSVFDRSDWVDPLEVIAAAEAMKSRYIGLISTLRAGEVEAEGVPVARGGSGTILRSVWSHPDFHFDAKTGDVYQTNDEFDVHTNDRLLKRWMAVMLRKPDASGSGFHVQHTPTHEVRPVATAKQEKEPSKGKRCGYGHN